MKKQRFASVWDAIEPSRAQAANMKARAEMMIAIRKAVAAWGLTQAATSETARAHAAAVERPAARTHQQVQPRCADQCGNRRRAHGARRGEGGVAWQKSKRNKSSFASAMTVIQPRWRSAKSTSRCVMPRRKNSACCGSSTNPGRTTSIPRRCSGRLPCRNW